MNMFDDLFGETMRAFDKMIEAFTGEREYKEPLPKGFIRGSTMTDEWIDMWLEKEYERS